MALRLIAAGTGSGIGSGSVEGSESELAGAISRTGDRREALGGPFIYVLVLLFSVLLFWTDSPIGIVAVATMAVGDGLADLIGRRFGSSNKWFFNKSKSMAGSAAFVAGSFAGSLGLISWLTKMNTLEPLQLTGLAGRLLAIAIICAGVELIPLGDDNWTVPVAAAVLSGMLLHA
jgi:dolichol kinase